MTVTSATNAPTQDVNVFRLQQNNDMQKEISVERNEREKSYKKYNKILSTVHNGSGIAAGSIGIASIVGFVLEGVAIWLGVTVMAIKLARSKLITNKIKKHDEIRVLAESKLNTINNHVLKAIENGCISQEEFVLISEERAKYSEMKDKIGTKFTPKESPKDAPPDVRPIDDKEKKELIETSFFVINVSKEFYDDDLIKRIKRLE